MKFALVNGEDTEATKGAKGFCKYCSSELVAHCGEVYAHHWKHKGKRDCDPWWEPETEWHRSWKDKFPVEWQEVIHFAKDGEKHIADVKTESDWVLEIQHSYLKPEERRARNDFYPKLAWVVDGIRRKRDVPQFNEALRFSTLINLKLGIRRVSVPDNCKLLKEWRDSNALVFFDFQQANETKQTQLWFLFPKISTSGTYIAPFSRNEFIKMHYDNKFDEFVKNIILPILEMLAGDKQIKRENKGHSRPSKPKGIIRQVPRHKNRRF